MRARAFLFGPIVCYFSYAICSYVLVRPYPYYCIAIALTYISSIVITCSTAARCTYVPNAVPKFLQLLEEMQPGTTRRTNKPKIYSTINERRCLGRGKKLERKMCNRWYFYTYGLIQEQHPAQRLCTPQSQAPFKQSKLTWTNHVHYERRLPRRFPFVLFPCYCISIACLLAKMLLIWSLCHYEGVTELRICLSARAENLASQLILLSEWAGIEGSRDSYLSGAPILMKVP